MARTRTDSTQLAHLSGPSRSFYRSQCRKFALAEHHRRLLLAACGAADRAEEARVGLAAAGSLIVEDRHGQQKAHPLLAVERDNRVLFARLLREIGLSADDTDSRPPRPSGRYEGRH